MMLCLLLVGCAGERGDGSVRDTTDVAAQPGTTWVEAEGCGVDFRGVGQEPGWVLEIDCEKEISLLTDYGQQRVVFPLSTQRSVADSAVTYRASSEAHSIEVRIEPTPCADVMSGEPYPATVAVRFDGRALEGCGRWMGTTDK